MGYFGTNYSLSNIQTDLTNIKRFTNQLKVYCNPLPWNSGGVTHSAAIALLTTIISTAKAMNMYVVWVVNVDQNPGGGQSTSNVLTDATTDLSQNQTPKCKWADYVTLVLADAQTAKSLSVEEFLVGNESRPSSH